MRALALSLVLATSAAGIAPALRYADEITLFGSDATPVAYIADDFTIYMWSGDPVAYLDSDPVGGFHVFGFNGKHLGWYVSGVLRDHGGNVVGARREVFSSTVKLEPFKSFKKFKPFKSFKEFAPFRPFLSNTWSKKYLDEFLLEGKS
jgi:hypothetical protein